MVGHGTFEKEQKHFVGILHFRAVHHSHQYSLLPRVGFSKFSFLGLQNWSFYEDFIHETQVGQNGCFQGHPSRK